MQREARLHTIEPSSLPARGEILPSRLHVDVLESTFSLADTIRAGPGEHPNQGSWHYRVMKLWSTDDESRRFCRAGKRAPSTTPIPTSVLENIPTHCPRSLKIATFSTTLDGHVRAVTVWSIDVSPPPCRRRVPVRRIGFEARGRPSLLTAQKAF